MRFTIFAALLLAPLIGLPAPARRLHDAPQAPPAGVVRWWSSSEDMAARLTPQADEAAAAHRPKAPEPSKTGFATVCGVTVAGKDYRHRCTVEGVDPGASGQTVLHFPDNVVTLTWRSATSATATFEGMVPMAVTVSATGGVTKFVFEDRVYFWVSDRQAAAEQLKTLK